jgi:phosphoglycerate dehydrogenase-like enzyme
MRIVVSIHDLPVWSIPGSEVSRLAAALPGDEIVDARDAEARRREFPSADVLFATRIRAEEFATATKLRWIQSSAVGVGPLLRPEVVRSSVTVTNARGVHSEAIAEHAIALMLAVRRSLHVAVRRQERAEWAQTEISQARVATASNSRVLVIGLGSIGSQVAAMAAGLGMHVTGIRRRLDAPAVHGVTDLLPPERLRQALPAADVIVLALPRTEETRAFIGQVEIDAMKPNAILVNVARGRLVDEPALIRALEAGRIAGAGLDAFTEEPLPSDSPFWRLPNVLVSPHTAAFAGDYWAPVVDLFVANVARFKRGDALVNVVDKALGY